MLSDNVLCRSEREARSLEAASLFPIISCVSPPALHCVRKKECLNGQDRPEEQGCAGPRTKGKGRLRRENASLQCGAAATCHRSRRSGEGRRDVAPARRSSLLRHVHSISQNQSEAHAVNATLSGITLPRTFFLDS